MSCSYHYYVIIPKKFDFDEYISISEHMGINVDIKEAKRIFTILKNRGHIHCQDTERWPDDKLSGFNFTVKVLKELDFVLEEYEDTSHSGGDWIYDISDKLIKKKKLISKIIEGR